MKKRRGEDGRRRRRQGGGKEGGEEEGGEGEVGGGVGGGGGSDIIKSIPNNERKLSNLFSVSLAQEAITILGLDIKKKFSVPQSLSL